MEVTTFQPARPPEMWSRDASIRAAWNGVKNVEDTVHTRPMRSVARAIADSAVSGSRDQWGPPDTSPTLWPSAKNTASNRPRSAVCASSS